MQYQDSAVEICMGMEWIHSHYMQGVHDSKQISVFLEVTPCWLVDVYTFPQERGGDAPSKHLVNFYQTRQSQIPAEGNLYVTVLAEV